MSGLKAIILAAGKSKRMKSSTPKVLHEVAGKPVLEYVLDQARSLDPLEIIVVVGHESERVVDAFRTYPKISFVEQREQLGTAHAVMQARAQLEGFDGNVLILCGDVPLLRLDSVNRFYDDFLAVDADASVLTALYSDPTGYGRIIRDGAGHFQQILEHKDCPEELLEIDECNTGTYLFKATQLLAVLDQIGNDNAQGEFYLPDTLQALLLQERSVGTTVLDDENEVIGIDNRRKLAIADAVMRGWIMRDILDESSVTLVDPATTYIDADVQIGRDTVIRPFTCIRRGVKIGENCEIGPFAHLRQGTVVGDDCKVGAFVETKNAEFLSGAKAGHMAYLGDVKLGHNVNIGAGTIVANYDGKKKHHTEIGDEAFIGCGTVLVAPVKVGKRGQTGANTVVPRNKDVPEGTIVVGAPARELKKRDAKGAGEKGENHHA